MLWPGERILRRIARRGKRDEVLWRLHQIGERNVCCQLLAYAKVHKKSDDGWVRRNFLKIFGARPPRDCSAEPVPDFLIVEEWIASR